MQVAIAAWKRLTPEEQIEMISNLYGKKIEKLLKKWANKNPTAVTGALIGVIIGGALDAGARS